MPRGSPAWHFASRDHGLDGHNSPARIRANSAAAVASTVTTASMVIISWLVGVMVGCSGRMRRTTAGEACGAMSSTVKVSLGVMGHRAGGPAHRRCTELDSTGAP